jgi:hypothetical protein
MRSKLSRKVVWTLAVVAFCLVGMCALPARAADTDPRDDASPWGMGGGPGDSMLAPTGAKWVRAFDEWQGVEPKQNQWNWRRTDRLVADAKKNHIHIMGWWWYFAPWASADGGTRKGPIKDMQMWRDYVTATVSRYHGDIKYWEVWNEFNGSFYQGREGPDRVKDYADFVVAAYDAAKKVDPTAKIGMSVASSDIGFLDLAIKAGAAGHFDFICVHPYENMGALMYGDDPGFLSLGGSLRQMLAATGQPVDTQLWITEFGQQTPLKVDAKADAVQAGALVKAYILCIAQGFQRVIWFGFRPWSDEGGDFGLIRRDGTIRPSYTAYKTMITVLGEEPKYLGWLDLGKGGYGFVFQGKDAAVLVGCAPTGKQYTTTFSGDVHVTDITGKESTLSSGTELTLTATPVFVTGLPADLVAQAKGNANKPFPWGGDYTQAKAIVCHLGKTNSDEGLQQVFLRKEHEGHSVGTNADGQPCRLFTSKDKDNACAYFRADTGYIPFGPRALDITVVAGHVAPDQAAELGISYETLAGYQNFPKGGDSWTIPAGAGWQEHTWHVRDACFAGRWGWHIGLMSRGASSEFLIKEVRVTKAEPTAP